MCRVCNRHDLLWCFHQSSGRVILFFLLIKKVNITTGPIRLLDPSLNTSKHSCFAIVKITQTFFWLAKMLKLIISDLAKCWNTCWAVTVFTKFNNQFSLTKCEKMVLKNLQHFSPLKERMKSLKLNEHI